MDGSMNKGLARLQGVRTDPGSATPSPKPRKGLFRTLSNSLLFFSKDASKNTEGAPSRTFSDEGLFKPKKKAKSSVANWRMMLADARVQSDIENKNRAQREEQVQKIMLVLQQKEEESGESDSEVEDLENIMRRANSLALPPRTTLGSVSSLDVPPPIQPPAPANTPAHSVCGSEKTDPRQATSPALVGPDKPDAVQQLASLLTQLYDSGNSMREQNRPHNLRFRRLASNGMPILLKPMPNDTAIRKAKEPKNEPYTLELLDPNSIRYIQSLPPSSECATREPNNAGAGNSESSEWESEGEVYVDRSHGLARRATVGGPPVRRGSRPAMLVRKRSQGNSIAEVDY